MEQPQSGFDEHSRSTQIDSLSPPRPSRVPNLISGAIIGGLIVWILPAYKTSEFRVGCLVLAGMVVGLLFGAIGRLGILKFLALCLLAGIVIVQCSPLVPWLVHGPAPADPLEAADAVVVLGTGVQNNGMPGTAAEDRLIHAVQLVRGGYARRIVLCGVLWAPTIRDALAVEVPNAELISTGPVFDTHDEALATARLARENHWNKVIVVTEFWHMPRAAAVFTKAGVTVIRSPCNESRYDISGLDAIGERMTALHDWAHEALGMKVYRWRGWID
jgi:uncharacterized SAM-binding protein YcdF (DUF218 family)